MKLTNKEAIANLNHIYGIVSPDIQRSLDLAIKALEERPQGEWKVTHNNLFECPFCHRLFDIGDNYCGFCGADMRKGGAE